MSVIRTTVKGAPCSRPSSSPDRTAAAPLRGFDRPVLLTAAPERTPPQADDMEPEGSECLDVGRHRVVGEVAGNDLLQPVPLFRDRLVQSSPHLLLDLLELCRHAVAAGF